MAMRASPEILLWLVLINVYLNPFQVAAVPIEEYEPKKQIQMPTGHQNSCSTLMGFWTHKVRNTRQDRGF